MTKVKRTVAFLWHPGMQYRLFGLMADALRNEVAVRLLGMPQLMVQKKLLSPISHRSAALPDAIDSLASYEYLRKTRRRPELATEQFKDRARRNVAEWYCFFQRRLKDVDLLVVWHGLKCPASAAILAAIENGAQVIFCENGLLPGTLAMDPIGINFVNSLTGLSTDFYKSIEMDPAKTQEVVSTALQQRPFRRTARVTKNNCDDDKELPDRYVLYAMQVHDDSQVLLFSPRFRSMESAVPYVADRLKEYNQRSGDNVRLIVKEHPSDFGRVDYAAMRAALPDVYFLRTTPVSDIIGRAAAVVTLNSTVGVEGLLNFRPVITLGDACYNVPGMVWHLGAEQDLADVLEEAVDASVDEDLITRFLYFLRYEYLVPVSKKSCNAANIGPATERVLDVLYGRWPYWEIVRPSRDLVKAVDERLED